jgi:hypothetical protein
VTQPNRDRWYATRARTPSIANHPEAAQRSARSLMWDIGDWWNRGEAYGERVAIVTAADWTGPTHGTCREAGRVAARWNVSNRIDTLGFKHHALVAPLSDGTRTSQPRSTSRHGLRNGALSAVALSSRGRARSGPATSTTSMIYATRARTPSIANHPEAAQ